MHKNTRPPVRVREVLPVALSTFRRSLPQILNYQLWTKLLFSGLLLPGFWLLVRFLMQSQGMLVITNSTLWEFMLRKEGAIVLAVALLLIFLGIIIELFGFVTISARTLHDQPEASYLSLVGKNIRLIPKFLGFGGLLLVVYLLVVVPLSGAGVGLSFISVRIPNFIGQAIEANPLYLLGYALLLLALLVLGIRWIFTLHYIVIAKYRPLAAMRASARLYRANRRSFLKIIFVIALLGVLITGLLLTGWAVVVFRLIDVLDFDRASARGIMLGLLMLQMVSGFLATILYVPFDVHILTILFYRFVKSSPEDAKLAGRVPQLPEKKHITFIDRLFRNRLRFVLFALLGITLLAFAGQGLFSELFTAPLPAQIVAHRGGGFGTPENSLRGLAYAVEHGADYTEVDVQRTKDGFYILHHDGSLSRILGIPERAEELTLEQIQSHRFLGPGPSEGRIVELSEFLDAARGKIRVMLELKGRTADERMADEVIALAKEKGMEQDIVITSLDYRLIQYMEQTYPEILTGYIYYLSVGDVSDLDGDYLIMEEGLATADRIESIRAAGKKSVVWTVNETAAMQTFLDRGVDAIITDEIKKLEEQLVIQDARSIRDRMGELFLPAQ